MEDGDQKKENSLNLNGQSLFMKKNLLIAAVALLTTAGVTATVIGTTKKKTTKEDTQKKEVKKKECSKSKRSTCIW